MRRERRERREIRDERDENERERRACMHTYHELSTPYTATIMNMVAMVDLNFIPLMLLLPALSSASRRSYSLRRFLSAWLLAESFSSSSFASTATYARKAVLVRVSNSECASAQKEHRQYL
jgi:hypothetical protein